MFSLSKYDFRCSANEKLEIIPEGELKPKPQSSNNENFITSRSTSQSARFIGTVKRTSNTEISSTTSLSRKAKQKKKVKRVSKSYSNYSKSKVRRISTDDNTDEELSTPRIRPDSSQIPSSARPHEVFLIEDDNEDTENIHSTTNTRTKSHLPPPTIGARLWAMYQGARRSGVVINVNDKSGTFKIRFDEFPTAEFDYWFTYRSSAWSYIGSPPPSTESTVTSAETTTSDEETICAIAKKFKALIKVKFSQ